MRALLAALALSAFVAGFATESNAADAAYCANYVAAQSLAANQGEKVTNRAHARNARSTENETQHGGLGAVTFGHFVEFVRKS
jgi:hypothetical protein